MKTLGQIGYEAYRNHTGGKSLATGANIPEWDSISPAIQAAWEVAAKAISDCEPGGVGA